MRLLISALRGDERDAQAHRNDFTRGHALAAPTG
jgi:hypothetical protein